jgi:hypothetical protein
MMLGGTFGIWRLMVWWFFQKFLFNNISFSDGNLKDRREKTIEGFHHFWIADLFPFSFLLFSKGKNKYHLWILWLYTIRDRLFSRCRGIKTFYVLEYLWLTGDNALSCNFGKSKAFSIHVAGFKHKIYRWRCFVICGDGAGKSSRLFSLCSFFWLRCHFYLFFYKNRY